MVLRAVLAPNLSRYIYADLIGKPFQDDGRGPDVYDCLGLAIEVQRRLGITVPDFLSSEAELHRQIAAGGFLADCEKLAVAEPGCVVLMRSLGGRANRHLGVMVDRFRMVHASEPAHTVVLERLSSSRWATHILGFYKIGEPGEPGSGVIPDPWSPA